MVRPIFRILFVERIPTLPKFNLLNSEGPYVGKWLLMIIYGLHLVWTGLWRGVDAQAYKPNALWFCTACGVLAIVAGVCYRINQRTAGAVIGLLVSVTVLAFYLNCFITQPEKDANFRVALAILSSWSAIVTVLLPGARGANALDESPTAQPQ